MPKRKFERLRDDEAIEREKKWRKQKLLSKREANTEIVEGWEVYAQRQAR